MSQEYDGTSKPDHAEEVFWLVFRANDHAAKVVKLGEQALDLPATPIATQHPAILDCFSASRGVVRSNQLHNKTLPHLGIQGVAVLSPIADQALGSFGEQASLDGGFNGFGFMR
jgi:hypothetical protein